MRALKISLLLACGWSVWMGSAWAQSQQNMPADHAMLSERVAGTPWTEPKTGMEFVWVPGGCFEMGNDHNGEAPQLQHDFERPAHQVCLQGFWMGRYEVTQAQYQKLMAKNPSVFGGTTRPKSSWGDSSLQSEYVQPKNPRNHPVEWVSFDDAMRFTDKMSRLTQAKIELPSEAQWEYACRAGGIHQVFCGKGDNPDLLAWYHNNSHFNPACEAGQHTYKVVPHHPVGLLTPNDWGLYDMSGNVEEWTRDCLDLNTSTGYQGAPVDGSARQMKGCRWRVVRGGFWGYDEGGVRATARSTHLNGRADFGSGFRVIKTVAQ